MPPLLTFCKLKIVFSVFVNLQKRGRVDHVTSAEIFYRLMNILFEGDITPVYCWTAIPVMMITRLLAWL